MSQPQTSEKLLPSVEEIIRQAEEHAARLEQARHGASSQTWPDLLQNLAETQCLMIRIILPMYKKFNNGGLPMAPRGQQFSWATPLGTIRFSGQGATTFAFRLFFAIALLRMMGVSFDMKKFLVNAQKIQHEEVQR